MVMTLECPKCGHTRTVGMKAIIAGWYRICPVCRPEEADEARRQAEKGATELTENPFGEKKEAA